MGLMNIYRVTLLPPSWGTQFENHGAAWTRGGVIDVGVIKELPLYISYSFTGFSMILSLWSSLKRDLFV